MRRSLLAISIFSLLSASSLLASPESDLLSKATDGAITTAKAEGVKVLSNDEMGDVKGGNSIDWNKKFELDVWYVDNISAILDLKIIYLTIVKVFKREGINVDQNNTMTPFNGEL
jgi:hypothetical protein